MSAKAIAEATGKRLLNAHLPSNVFSPCRFASVDESTSWEKLKQDNTWLNSEVYTYLFLDIMQSGILERFSKVLPNSHFRNGGINRNWSKIFIIFFDNSMKH